MSDSKIKDGEKVIKLLGVIFLGTHHLAMSLPVCFFSVFLDIEM